MSELTFIDRKELARILECNVTQVRDNELGWGIDVTRRDLNERVVRYLRVECLAILASRGIYRPVKTGTALPV